MDVQVIDHPLVAAALRVLRDEATADAGFRAALRDLSMMLVYEAARPLPVRQSPVRTPIGEAPGAELADHPVLVPVLRAGLGMIDAALALLPGAQVGFVGVARDERTHLPAPYLESLPPLLAGRPTFVLDPMLATGGSLAHTLGLLVARGADQLIAVCVLAAPEGVAHLESLNLPVRLVTAAIDERLDDDAFIVPGLGDAGDRQFGPR